jgi:hypothetical protein
MTIATAGDNEVSADHTTGHRRVTQGGVTMDGWRIAFGSHRSVSDLYVGLEKELGPAGWRIMASGEGQPFRAYISPDGAYMLGVSSTGTSGEIGYEFQLMHSTPPQLKQAYADGRPIE